MIKLISMKIMGKQHFFDLLRRIAGFTLPFTVFFLSTLNSQEKENADFKLAVGLYNDAMYDLAAEQLNNFVNTYPNTSNGIEARYYLGLTQMQLKRYDEARITFQNFALNYSEHPKAAGAWLMVGDAFLAVKNYTEAASAYERIRVFHPKNRLVPDALWKAGEIYRQINDRENAKKNFRTIIQDYPNDPHALQSRLAIGELYAEEGQIDLAEREIKRVAESEAAPIVKASALYSLGKLQANLCLFADAESTFTSIITSYKNTPAFPFASYNLGILAMSGRNYQAALEHLKRAAEDKNLPDSLLSDILFATGTAYNQLKNYPEAFKAFGKILSGKPDISDAAGTTRMEQNAAIETGWSAYRARDYKTASRIATEILKNESHPLRVRAFILAGESALSANNYNDAVKYYSRFLTEYGDTIFSPQIAMKLAGIYENRLKEYDKAISVYRSITEDYASTIPAVNAGIGVARCYELLGNYDECIRAYNSLQHNYPAHAEYEAIQREIEFLKNHMVKNRDPGMEKLARLLGEIIEDKSKSELSFKLGEIYFNEIKDYNEAARQFAAAYRNNPSDETKLEAKYWLARSHHLLSEIDSNYFSEALTSYDDFLRQFPNTIYTDQAAFHRYTLEGKQNSVAEKILSATDYVTKYPNSEFAEKVAYDLGNYLLQEGDTTKALTTFRELLAKKESSLILQDIYLTLGSIHYAHKRTDSALTNWNKVLSIPGLTKARLLALWGKAEIAGSEGNDNEAILNWKKIIEEFPYTDIAKKTSEFLPAAYLNTGNYDEALALYASEQKQEHDFSPEKEFHNDFNYFIGTIFEKQGKRDEAAGYYRKYLSENRTGTHASRAFYALGAIAKAEDRIGQASAYFKLASSSGEETKATREIADILFQTDQYDEAARYYIRLAQSTSVRESSMVYLSRAIVSILRTGKVIEADRLITEFRKTYPNNKMYDGEFTYERALVSYRNQDFTTAKKLLSVVIDDYEETSFGPWAHYYLAKILEQTNKTEEAVKKYEWLQRNTPNSDVIPRVLLSLGNINFNAEKDEEAIRFYQQIVKSPERAGDVLSYAMNNLIEAYTSTKLYDEALKVTRDFLESFPNDESVLEKKISIGVLYTRLGYYDQAILHLQNLIPEAGSLLEAELRYNIGEAYYYKGDYQQAILEFLKVPYVVTQQGKVNWTATSLYMAGQAYEKISRFDQAIEMYKQIIERPGIDATFKSAARKEIDRVNSIIKKGN